MREVLFRGKRVSNGQWVYGSYIPSSEGSHSAFIYRDSDYFNEVKEESVGQFTGLHDENGREIYEGDLVRRPDGTRAEMAWQHHMWVFKYYDGKAELRQAKCKFEEVEVIGNVHENLELLQ